MYGGGDCAADFWTAFFLLADAELEGVVDGEAELSGDDGSVVSEVHDDNDVHLDDSDTDHEALNLVSFWGLGFWGFLRVPSFV